MRAFARSFFRFPLCVALGAALFLAGPMAPPAAAQGATGAVTGLPLPRFVSLKSDRVNVRKGPSRDHAVQWVFQHAGMPIEVIGEFENWRRIRDRDGDKGWVYHSLLDGRRTAIVKGDPDGDLARLYEIPDQRAEVIALAEPGVVGALLACKDDWCRVSASGHTGWIARRDVWGAYESEEFD